MLDQLCDQASRIIANVLPDRAPHVRFYEAPGDGPLEEQVWGDADEPSRAFHVLAAGQGFGGWGEFYGTLADGTWGFVVQVRYVQPTPEGGFVEADRLAAADQVRLAHELAVAPTLDDGPCGWGDDLSPIVELVGQSWVRHPPEMYLLTLAFSAQLAVQQNQ